MSAALRIFAPAKVNLALHVTGQRPDGYHLIDTLVGFASVGDWVTIDDRQAPGLAITGPEAAALDPAAPNLVTRTVAEFWGGAPLGLRLDKHLPVSSGIGGGSADAAATFRGLAWLMERSRGPAATPARAAARLLALGADVPMCVPSVPARVRGIGERVEPVTDLARLSLVLVNPRVALATPAVFGALRDKANSDLGDLPADPGDAPALTAFLTRQRNDLQAPALALAPVIGAVLDRLAASAGCQLARMSGSGATCFGIYPDAATADQAARRIARDTPAWWVKSAVLDGQSRAAPEMVS
ncbi:MAG: 4-(cytidine 5'-diphospho)-2-C-methyl-D-erythritol kinase [Paracoccaceae bacterium]